MMFMSGWIEKAFDWSYQRHMKLMRQFPSRRSQS